MKLNDLFLLAASSGALAVQYATEDHTSGTVMNKLKAMKFQTWDSQLAAGAYNSSRYPSFTSNAKPVRCVKGLAVVQPGNANQTFRCNNIDMLDFKNHFDLGSSDGRGSGSWGWVAPNGREIAAIAQRDGLAFAEITKDGKLVYLGRLPNRSSENTMWREPRSYKNYMIVASDSLDHYVQIFDMRKLLTINPTAPKVFNPNTDLTGLAKDNIPRGSVHNIVVNEEKDYMVAVGATSYLGDDACQAGLIFFDLKNPAKPTSPGCAPQNGYVHDAQCVVYRGPDKKYNGRDICYGYNGGNLTIYDVTNKSGLTASTVISTSVYEGSSYIHQGVVTDLEWQKYLLIDDEYDEVSKSGLAADGHAITYIFDISNLEKPFQTGYYRSSERSVDHNQYVWGNRTYQSNYNAGLRVLDISSIPRDPTGAGVKEIAFIDIYPEDDGKPPGSLPFVGTWSSYAGFPSGNILINTIERGAFVVKLDSKLSVPKTGY